MAERAVLDPALFAFEREGARRLLGVLAELEELRGREGVLVPVAACIAVAAWRAGMRASQPGLIWKAGRVTHRR